MLYILRVHDETMSSPWNKWVIKHEETRKKKWGYGTYYMRCWLRLLQHSWLCHHTLNPTPCCNLEVLIVTTWLLNWELYYLCYHWTLCLVVATTILDLITSIFIFSLLLSVLIFIIIVIIIELLNYF